METGDELTRTRKAKTVIIATGGAGRLHYQGFPTSNHYGATADGLVLAYQCQAQNFCMQDTLTVSSYRCCITRLRFIGALVTEKVRLLWAHSSSMSDGEVFMHPLETRDVCSIWRQLSVSVAPEDKGIHTPLRDVGVWLDSSDDRC